MSSEEDKSSESSSDENNSSQESDNSESEEQSSEGSSNEESSSDEEEKSEKNPPKTVKFIKEIQIDNKLHTFLIQLEIFNDNKVNAKATLQHTKDLTAIKNEAARKIQKCFRRHTIRRLRKLRLKTASIQTVDQPEFSKFEFSKPKSPPIRFDPYTTTMSREEKIERAMKVLLSDDSPPQSPRLFGNQREILLPENQTFDHSFMYRDRYRLYAPDTDNYRNVQQQSRTWEPSSELQASKLELNNTMQPSRDWNKVMEQHQQATSRK